MLPLRIVMQGFYKIVFMLAVAVAVVSCEGFKPVADGDVLASVGEKKLLMSDVEGIFSSGMAPNDSLVLLESYVNMWVRKQVKIMEAEKLFSESSADIDQMVTDYRNSLLTHKLDQYYIDYNIDTLITDSEIANYYNDHRVDFVLDRPVVKGRIVKLPNNYRQKAKLKELMPGQGDKYQDFHDMALKNGFDVYEFASWTDLAQFMTELPSGRVSGESLLKAKGVSEIVEGGDLYYAYISESRGAGDIAPLDRVRGLIRQILYHQRRLDVLRNYEDSIYRTALDAGIVEMKIN